MSKMKSALWDQLIERQQQGDLENEGPSKIDCVTCEGLGEWDEGPLPARSSVQISPEYKRVICPECEGKGWLMSDEVPA